MHVVSSFTLKLIAVLWLQVKTGERELWSRWHVMWGCLLWLCLVRGVCAIRSGSIARACGVVHTAFAIVRGSYRPPLSIFMFRLRSDVLCPAVGSGLAFNTFPQHFHVMALLAIWFVDCCLLVVEALLCRWIDGNPGSYVCCITLAAHSCPQRTIAAHSLLPIVCCINDVGMRCWDRCGAM